MKARVLFVVFSGMLVLVAVLALITHRNPPARPEAPVPDATLASVDSAPASMPSQPGPSSATPAARSQKPSFTPPEEAPTPAPPANKLEQLREIRENFHLLAAGDAAGALRAAKQLTDETQRETALLALVTEWTKGELSSPRQRAEAIAMYGLEAGLGLELAKNPDLAVLWANELTQGVGRTVLLQQTAIGLLESDPVAAFSLGEQVPQTDQRKFTDSVFAGWAAKDTEAAIQWAGQLPTAEQRDAALEAIRTMAPVGIGAAVRLQDGYPVINQLLPGTPAALSGQLHPGDRILALAQGGNPFVETRSLPLPDVVQMIRGAPGTLLQLQVLPADAPPGSPPRTIAIVRDQIKFKK